MMGDGRAEPPSEGYNGSVSGASDEAWNSQMGSNVNMVKEDESLRTNRGCWARCNYSCIRACRPCLTEFNELDENSSCWERFQYVFMCPAHGKIASWTAKFIGAIMIWGTFWAITGDEALPGGNFFGILIMSYLSEIAANFVKLTPLPPLLGMLMVGFGVRNIPVIKDWCPIDSHWASALRSVALVIILLRAGSGLDPKALRKTKWVALRLALFPCIAEAGVCAVVAHYLVDFPWTWAFVMGFVYAAVSPAVVVQGMVALQDKGWGRREGIPTLLVAACGINDVLAISGFSIVLGIALSQGSILLNALHGPIEFALGIVLGIVIGVLFWYFPNKNSKQLLLYRFILLFTAGLFATFGLRRAKYSGAGTLGTLVMAFVAGIGWRKRTWSPKNFPIKGVLMKAWKVFQPILFGLIGYAVSIDNLKKGNVGLGIAMLFIGLAARLVVTFFSAYGQNFNFKEKIFMVIAWIPKATVQAAIGSVALDTAMSLGADEATIKITTEILTNAAVCIIITAPLGAAGIALSAPFLLKPSNPDEEPSGDAENGSIKRPKEGVVNRAYDSKYPKSKEAVVGLEYITKL